MKVPRIQLHKFISELSTLISQEPERNRLLANNVILTLRDFQKQGRPPRKEQEIQGVYEGLDTLCRQIVKNPNCREFQPSNLSEYLIPNDQSPLYSLFLNSLTSYEKPNLTDIFEERGGVLIQEVSCKGLIRGAPSRVHQIDYQTLAEHLCNSKNSYG